MPLPHGPCPSLPLLAGGHAAGDPPAEILLVSLVLLVLWGIYRVTTKSKTG